MTTILLTVRDAPLNSVLNHFFCIFFKEQLKEGLDAFIEAIKKQNPHLKFVQIRHERQMGLAQARISGWGASSADVVAILDAHIEVNVKWWAWKQII